MPQKHICKCHHLCISYKFVYIFVMYSFTSHTQSTGTNKCYVLLYMYITHSQNIYTYYISIHSMWHGYIHYVYMPHICLRIYHTQGMYTSLTSLCIYQIPMYTHVMQLHKRISHMCMLKKNPISSNNVCCTNFETPCPSW